MNTTREIKNLIKDLPRRDNIFTKLKAKASPGAPRIRALSPTRWTIPAESLQSIRLFQKISPPPPPPPMEDTELGT